MLTRAIGTSEAKKQKNEPSVSYLPSLQTSPIGLCSPLGKVLFLKKGYSLNTLNSSEFTV